MLETKSFVFHFDHFEVREREFCLVKSGELIAVEPKAFRVLLMFLRNPQKLITKDELLQSVWAEAAVTENSLARSIALLRRLLGDSTRNPRYIETVATVGYRFMCNVKVHSGEEFEDRSSLDAPSGSAQTDEEAGVEVADISLRSEFDKGTRGGGRKITKLAGLSLWMLAGTAVCAAAGLWYLLHPPPLPHITAYSQITYDGARKTLIGTDGSRLYFGTSAVADSIAEVANTGGALSLIPIPVPNFAFPEDVSSDGANFLIATNEKGLVLDRPQWNLRVPSGSRFRLPDGGNAAFAPDGKSVAYQTAEGELWVSNSDGSGAHRLCSEPSSPGRIVPSLGGSDRFFIGRVSWSPDGSVLRFGIAGRLWEIPANGANLHEVMPGWHPSSSQCCGNWTPDGKLFVFLETPGGPLAQPEIWALSEGRELLTRAHGQPVQLTAGPIAWGPPIMGKDGKKIFASGNTRRGELVRFDLKTKQFQPFLAGISAQFVSFSRDGKYVAYVSYPEGTLWRANRDGSNPVQLTEPPINAVVPRWSPDGSQILFSDFRSMPVTAYIVSATGGNPQRLLPESHESQGDPNWSVDGRKVVFTTADPFTPKGSLHIVDLATHQITTLPGSEGLYSPRWSPDGRFIAAMPVDATGLKIFNVETQKWIWLSQKDTFAFPAWSRDSRSIYFYRIANGDRSVFRIGAGGGPPEHIADLNSIHLGGWWNWMGLDPTDAPVVLRDIGSDDIFALDLARK